MGSIFTLALPFFGLIFLGFFAGKWFREEAALGWLNIFVLYFALPALFFSLVSATPFEELANWAFVATTTTATACTFALAFAVGALITRGGIAQGAIQGGLGAYANVGYLGPGLTLAALGSAATVPTALIFTFDSMLMFALVPLLMAVAGNEARGLLRTLAEVVRRIATHPFIVATALGVIAAYFNFTPPQALDRLLAMLSGAAAPCALFAIGVTVAQRPVTRMPNELPFLIVCKLLLHPLIALMLLTFVGGFDPVWVKTGLLMAALPPALNMFVLAEQYGVYVERASTTILVATASSFVTVTGLLYLIARDLLPI
jgi:hypothetical protein